MKSMYYWLGKHVHARYGIYIFALLVFIEGFFIVPVSTLLAFFCLENKKRAFLYAAIATLVSALGALAGYSIGALLWKWGGQKLIYYIIAPQKFAYLVEQYKAYQAWAVFGVALTPMPFKALTLTAGFCQLPIAPFVFFALIARGLRFFAIAGSIYIWADKVNYYIDTYFYYIVALGVVFFVLTWWLLH